MTINFDQNRILEINQGSYIFTRRAEGEESFIDWTDLSKAQEKQCDDLLEAISNHAYEGLCIMDSIKTKNKVVDRPHV